MSSMKYPYRDLGVPFDRKFRNDLNANFDDIEHDIRMIGGEAAQQALEAAEEANTQAIYAQTSGDYANDKGDYAAQQGDYAQTQGNFANEKGLYAQQQGDYAKAQGDYAKQVGDENKTRWLTAVNTYADIATTYPNPQLGDTVQTIDDSKIYRWDGTQWVWTQQYNANAITDVQNKIGILLKKSFVSVTDYGAVGDGVTDDTAAIQAAIDAIATNGGGGVYFPRLKFKITEIRINTKNIHLFGEGILYDGHILIGDDTTVKDLDYRIDGLTFERDSIADGKHAIELQNARKGRIYNCLFRNFDKTIYVRPKPGFQHTTRCLIYNNIFHSVNYCVYIDRDASYSSDSYYTVGDFHFVNNQADEGVRITHFYGKGVDGLVMVGNTLLFPNFADQSQTKEYNVWIDYGNFITIVGNNLFEAGYDGIKLSRCQNFNIKGNNIAWAGQRQPSAGVRLSVGDIFGTSDNNGSVCYNNIESPSYVGVDIEGNVGNVVVQGNNIQKIGDTQKYYGTIDISSYGKWGVRSQPTTKNILVTGNLLPNGEIQLPGMNNQFSDNLDKYGNRQRSNNVVTISTATNTLNPNGVDQFNLNPSSAMTVDTIVATYSGHEITLLAFNGNTTIQNNSGIVLKGGVNTTIPNGGMLKLRYTTGKWYEVSRSY